MRIIVIIFFIGSFSLFGQQMNSVSNTQKSAEKTCFVYGSNSCSHCMETKLFLTKQGVIFKFFDIDEDTVALRSMLNELHKKGISTKNLGIPVVIYGDEVFMNNQPFEMFLEMLKKIK